MCSQPCPLRSFRILLKDGRSSLAVIKFTSTVPKKEPRMGSEYKFILHAKTSTRSAVTFLLSSRIDYIFFCSLPENVLSSGADLERDVRGVRPPSPRFEPLCQFVYSRRRQFSVMIMEIVTKPQLLKHVFCNRSWERSPVDKGRLTRIAKNIKVIVVIHQLSLSVAKITFCSEIYYKVIDLCFIFRKELCYL